MVATLQFHLAAPIKSQIQRPKAFSNAITYRKSAKVRCFAAAVPTKRSYTITLLPGDGIGPEIVSVAKDVLTHAASLEGFKVEVRFSGWGKPIVISTSLEKMEFCCHCDFYCAAMMI